MPPPGQRITSGLRMGAPTVGHHSPIRAAQLILDPMIQGLKDDGPLAKARAYWMTTQVLAPRGIWPGLVVLANLDDVFQILDLLLSE